MQAALQQFQNRIAERAATFARMFPPAPPRPAAMVAIEAEALAKLRRGLRHIIRAKARAYQDRPAWADYVLPGWRDMTTPAALVACRSALRELREHPRQEDRQRRAVELRALEFSLRARRRWEHRLAEMQRHAPQHEPPFPEPHEIEFLHAAFREAAE
jgi:hypothetical protein